MIFLDILDPLDEALLEEEAVQQPESKRYTVCVCHVMRPPSHNGHAKVNYCTILLQCNFGHIWMDLLDCLENIKFC